MWRILSQKTSTKTWISIIVFLSRSLEPEGEAEKLEVTVLWNEAGLLRESCHSEAENFSMRRFCSWHASGRVVKLF